MRGMNQKRKRLGLWILFLAALLLTQFTVPVKASEPQIQDVNIQMVGGQIRTIDPMGLRMVACIKKSYIQELEKSGATVSYGIVLLPKKYLTEGQALTLDGKYLYNGSVYKPAKVPAVTIPLPTRVLLRLAKIISLIDTVFAKFHAIRA